MYSCTVDIRPITNGCCCGVIRQGKIVDISWNNVIWRIANPVIIRISTRLGKSSTRNVSPVIAAKVRTADNVGACGFCGVPGVAVDWVVKVHTVECIVEIIIENGIVGCTIDIERVLAIENAVIDYCVVFSSRIK